MHSIHVVFSAVVLAANLTSANAEVPENVRIALRLSSGKVLMIGGELKRRPGVDYRRIDRAMESSLPIAGQSQFQPMEQIVRVSPGYLSRFRIEPTTTWRTGDRWILYTGAGRAVPVAIDFPVSGGAYEAVLASIVSPADQGLVEGLRSEAYLTAPVGALREVSTRPLVPVDVGYEDLLTTKVAAILLERAKKTVADESWKADQPEAVAMNRRFRTSSKLREKGRLQRWAIPGRKPLLFAEWVWSDEKGAALFAATAVLEESAGKVPVVLDFDPRYAEMMRIPEFLGEGGWEQPELPAFLNAWAIGNSRFVLRYTRGYEGFIVELLELVPGKGLLPTRISFGSGA